MKDAVRADVLQRFPALMAQLDLWQVDAVTSSVPSGASGDEALDQACTELLVDEQCGPHVETIDPADWESFQSETQRLHERVQEIASLPAHTSTGLRAKARVLQTLLGQGNVLYEDASASDRIAWSLVQDVLAIQDIIE